MEIKFDKDEVKEILIAAVIKMLSLEKSWEEMEVVALESYGNFTVEITDRKPVEEIAKGDETDGEKSNN